MKTKREGFTLVEAVIAMVLLSVVLTALAGMTYYTARLAIVNKDYLKRDGYALEMVNKLDAMPWASLPTTSACETTGSGLDRYQRCLTITSTTRQRTFTVVATPLQRSTKSVTYTFIRSAPPPTNPLCSPSC
jgi:prepilin-type N-terminal cleavage/methylation domain-containing protein